MSRDSRSDDRSGGQAQAVRREPVAAILRQSHLDDIAALDQEYLLDTNHGADYFRRWHAHIENSGTLLVHKSTHHFDLVNWWLDAIPQQVFAYGGGRCRLGLPARSKRVPRGDFHPGPDVSQCALPHRYGPAQAPDSWGRTAGHEQGAASIAIGIAGVQSIQNNLPVNISEVVSLKPQALKLSELV